MTQDSGDGTALAATCAPLQTPSLSKIYSRPSHESEEPSSPPQGPRPPASILHPCSINHCAIHHMPILRPSCLYIHACSPLQPVRVGPPGIGLSVCSRAAATAARARSRSAALYLCLCATVRLVCGTRTPRREIAERSRSGVWEATRLPPPAPAQLLRSMKPRGKA